MRTAIVLIILSALFGCGTTGTGTGSDIDAGSDGPSRSDGSNGGLDGGVDSGGTSYAPCDTCCDPIEQNCPMTQACYENAQFNGTYCATAGTRPAGTVCSIDSDCAEGNTCLGAGFNQCRKFCVVDSDCAASPMHRCELYAVAVGHNPYGICF